MAKPNYAFEKRQKEIAKKKRLQKIWVDDSLPQDVQSKLGNDNKAVTTGDT